jgi:EAL domain-containing protein (putative c-di-GMP-specific phosphodiesterase class I)
MSYLREIRFDQVKLDGSLVKAAEECPERQRLLGAVIGLCQALDVPAVAEHVETEEQLKLLLELGCGAGQGYWLHRPISSDAAREVSSHLSFPHPPRAKRPSLAA